MIRSTQRVCFTCPPWDIYTVHTRIAQLNVCVYTTSSDRLEGFNHHNHIQNHRQPAPHRPAPSRSVLLRADSNPPFVRKFLRLDEAEAAPLVCLEQVLY
jgi:hypothetical protein